MSKEGKMAKKSFSLTLSNVVGTLSNPFKHQVTEVYRIEIANIRKKNLV